MLTTSVLKIDLSTEKIEAEELDADLRKKYLGGSGVGWRLAAEYLKSDTDPFSPENPIIVNVGVLVGTLCPGASKVTAITKFPIIATKDGKYFVGASTGGGKYFGVMMKMAGYDLLIITGRSEKPAYLKISDDLVEIKDATGLWGMGVDEVTNELLAEEGECCGVLAMGPAGENKVRYAEAFLDKTNSLGRAGLGAVMGSKNLKAVVVKGTKRVSVAKPKEFMEIVGELHSRIIDWPEREHWISLGMGAGWSTFKHTQYPGKWPRSKWEELYGEPIRLLTLEKVIPCYSCLIGCRIKWKIKDGEFAGETGMGSPYGKSATSGQLLGVEDHRKMIHWVTLANRAGIDFYTTTRIIDFVTTLYQHGEIKKEDTGGLKLKRDYEAYLNLFHKIVNREGFGDVLADGWMRLHQEFGLNPQDYWYGGICKGVDFIYDARASNFHPLMMTFFTRPRPHHGGSHTLTNSPGKSLEEIRNQVERWGIPKDAVERVFTPTTYSGKFNVGRYTKYMEDMMRVKNALGVCSIYTFFGLIFGGDLARLYSAATGLEVTGGDLMTCGERISNLSKLLNVREGFTRKDDKVPELWLRPMESPEGKIETMDYFKTKIMTKKDIEKILDDYYEERGWDVKKGIPTKQRLTELELNDVARALQLVKN